MTHAKIICSIIATKKAIDTCVTESLVCYAEVFRGQLADLPPLPFTIKNVRDIDQVIRQSLASVRRWLAQAAVA